MRRAVGLVAALAILAGGLAAWRLLPHDRTPFSAESIHPVLRIRFLDPQEAYPFAIPDARGSLYRTVRGDLSWQPPAGFDGWKRGHFAIFVIAARSDLPAPQLWAATPGTSALQSDPARVLDRLPGSGPLDLSAVYRNAATVGVSPSAAKVTFVAGFRTFEQDDWQRRVLADAPVELTDLVVELAFIGPDGRAYWTRRLHG